MSFDAALTEHNERRRIAIESHDRVAQPLAMAVVKLNSAIGPLSGETRQAVEGAVELLEQAIVEQRELIFDLSPPILYDLGLEDAIAWFADELEKRHGTKIELLSAEGEAALDDVTKGVVFRAVRELLTNVIKHAQVRSAKVSLRRADGQLEVVVEDGGVGFDAEAPTQRTFDGGFGMLSLRAQVASLGGTLKIESAPRQGTRVTLQVPARAHDQRPDEHEVTP
jgi:signal transduction histidine kinase